MKCTFAITTAKVSFTLTVVAERDTPSPAPCLESEAMAAGTSTPPMSAGAPFTYGGYATTPTIHSPGITTPTKVKTPPKYVKHARFLPDVEDVLQDVEHYAAIEDNRGFIDAVKKAFRAMQSEFSAVSECINRHSGSLESHHTSFYNAHGTFNGP